MGAPESAQNSKCGSIQTQHDFPHLLCEREIIFFSLFDNGRSSLKWFISSKNPRSSLKWSFRSSLKSFSGSSEGCEVHAGPTCSKKKAHTENTQGKSCWELADPGWQLIFPPFYQGGGLSKSSFSAVLSLVWPEAQKNQRTCNSRTSLPWDLGLRSERRPKGPEHWKHF